MLLKTLDKRLKKIGHTFEYVNYGGCACVAAMLAVALRPKYPIMRIVTAETWSDSSSNLDEVRPNLMNNYCKNEWSSNGVGFGHLWVEIYVDHEWYALDSDGVRPVVEMYKTNYVPAEGSFSIDEVQALADEESWNDTFDRSQIPAIQEYIAKAIH